MPDDDETKDTLDESEYQAYLRLVDETNRRRSEIPSVIQAILDQISREDPECKDLGFYHKGEDGAWREVPERIEEWRREDESKTFEQRMAEGEASFQAMHEDLMQGRIEKLRKEHRPETESNGLEDV